MTLLERAAEDYLRYPQLTIKLFELAPPMIVVGPRGLIKLLNRRAELLTGYERGEIYDQPVEVLLPDSLKEKHAAIHRPRFYANPRERPMGVGLKLALRQKDGTEVPVDLDLQPIPHQDGLLVLVGIQLIKEVPPVA